MSTDKIVPIRKNSQRRYAMNVRKEGEQYRCNICGNEVKVTKAGGGELVCCGEPMENISG